MSIPKDSLSLSGSMLLRSSWYCSGDRGHPVSGTSTMASPEVASSGSGPSQSIPYRSNSSWKKKKKENFNDKRWIEIRQLSFYSSYIKSYRKEPKGWLLLIYLHSFKQIFSNHQKSAGNWPLLKLLIGKWLHKRMRINWRCSHFWTPCCKLELGLSIPFN